MADMKRNKLKVEKSKVDLNLKFYFLLKNLIKSKFSPRQIFDVLDIINLKTASTPLDSRLTLKTLKALV